MNVGKHFTGKYQTFYLIYYEVYVDVSQAIEREKEIKGWSRRKKMNLILSDNPTMRFLNDDII